MNWVYIAMVVNLQIHYDHPMKTNISQIYYQNHIFSNVILEVNDRNINILLLIRAQQLLTDYQSLVIMKNV